MQAGTNVPPDILRRIALANRANPYVDITPFLLQIRMPVIYYAGFFPRHSQESLHDE